MAVRHEEVVDFIPQLRRYARSLEKDPTTADDLVQDCLERAMQRLDQYQPGTNMRAWLFTIMHSIFVNRWRRSARQGLEVGLEDWTEGSQREPTQEHRLMVRDMQRALAQLPEDSRSVLMLVGVEGFSYQEAAEILDVPMGTVRSRLSRARAMLRASMMGIKTEDCIVPSSATTSTVLRLAAN